MASSPDEAPLWILRHHAPSPIHALRLIRLRFDRPSTSSASTSTSVAGDTSSTPLLLAGDGQGRISLTYLHDLRPSLLWKAHDKGILGVDLVHLAASRWVILSQGRDNRLLAHEFQPVPSRTTWSSRAVVPNRIQDQLPTPTLLWSLDVNALNYCPMSTLPVPRDPTLAAHHDNSTLVALPHTLDSGFVDVLCLSPQQRWARAVGEADLKTPGSRAQRAPMCMSINMVLLPERPDWDNAATPGITFSIVAGYEDGYVRHWRVTPDLKQLNKEGQASIGMAQVHLLWSIRSHTESIMSTACDTIDNMVISIGADDRIVRYDLREGREVARITCRSMGNASVIVCGPRQDQQRRIAVGGWDGTVRIYGATLEHHLASFRYHKDTVQAMASVEEKHIDRTALATGTTEEQVEALDSDHDDTDEEDGSRWGPLGDAIGPDQLERLLVTGGKEGRICLWKIA